MAEDHQFKNQDIVTFLPLFKISQWHFVQLCRLVP